MRDEDACVIFALNGRPVVTDRCSIVIPVHGRAGLTRQCLDAILAEPPRRRVRTGRGRRRLDGRDAAVLEGYGEPARSVRLDENRGFAGACNAGAEAAHGELLVFLNNDTIPRPAGSTRWSTTPTTHPAAGIVGAKLLFPNETVQHAGVVICQDGNPRHLYAGFPAAHPAVNVSAPFQAVTAACMLVRREAFDAVGGSTRPTGTASRTPTSAYRPASAATRCTTATRASSTTWSRSPEGGASKEIERNAKLFRSAGTGARGATTSTTTSRTGC